MRRPLIYVIAGVLGFITGALLPPHAAHTPHTTPQHCAGVDVTTGRVVGCDIAPTNK